MAKPAKPSEARAAEANPAPVRQRRKIEWLSHGFEELVARLPQRRTTKTRADFDVVIVGSGYGAAMAASELAGAREADGKPTRVCILERGREYLPGSFPSRLSELAGHVRFSNGKPRARGECLGLLDARLGEDINALVANGLGGGSLINAGVMEEPLESVFQTQAWPGEIRSDSTAFMQTLKDAGKLLGSWKKNASGRWRPNVWPDPTLAKYSVLKEIGGQPLFKAPKLTVAVADGRTSANVRTSECVRCGDCMTGCNYQAKESLDVSLLVAAKERGAKLYCGATVLFLRPRKTGEWGVFTTYTDPKLRRRQKSPVEIIAKRVVLAAGTFGSTEILLRSREETAFPLSPRLGTGFSANGDMIVAVVDLGRDANATGDETIAAKSRKVGPTITGMIDDRAGNGIVVQDLSVPGPLRRVGQEIVAMADAFDVLSRGDTGMHKASDPDPCAIDDAKTAKTLTLAVMGHDTSDGRIELVGENPEQRRNGREGDGAVRIVWPQAKDDLRLAKREDRIKELLAKSTGRLLSNPLWRVLPSKLEFLFGNERGPLLTVHPLGGCPVADNVFLGVVNHIGQVFRGPPNLAQDIDAREPESFPGTDVYESLVVLDGSIVPGSLGMNPALTIAALALRASRALLSKWSLQQVVHAPLPDQTRPVFRKLRPTQKPSPAKLTQVQVIERLSGPVRVGSEDMQAELSLEFQPRDIRSLMSPDAAARRLDVVAKQSRLRLFTMENWEKARCEPSREPPDKDAHAIWPVAKGELRIFAREPSGALARRLRSALPWFNNRGWRDIAQTLLDRLHDDDSKTSPQPGLFDLIAERSQSTWRLLALAGEVRLLEYDLTLGKRTKGHDPGDWDGASLHGVKRLSYSRRGNPWRQLTEVRCTDAPFRAAEGDAVLSLDPNYLARREVPLLRVASQQDQPTALVDLASFVLYLMRILMRVHTWSFRKPDSPKTREICRLPGYVPDLGTPEVLMLPVGRRTGASGSVVNIRLARYPRAEDPNGKAVLMIHGYSASGTTFAHHATPSLARYLRDRGWDVWVVDLRTSAGMPTARVPWTFEEVANADIPVAIDHVFHATGKKPIDVVAHCMGSAMLNMALLGDGPKARGNPQGSADDPYWEMRALLPSRIRRLVMSQVAPLTMFSRANVLRAFVMRYVREYLDVDGYAFRVEGQASFGDHLLDRLLATLPYPESEFDFENPPFLRGLRRPWVGTRHRMDALYGRDFSVKNMSPQMLAYIDDHFGPLSIETVSQAIHFARFGQLADSNGNTRFASPQRILKRLTFPMLSIHGEENGLADKSTLDYMTRLREKLGPAFDFEPKLIEGCGHQDSLIGVTAKEKVFPVIYGFLRKG